ncbi:unnamed protein product, partial [Prorocentrum cordatum]
AILAQAILAQAANTHLNTAISIEQLFLLFLPAIVDSAMAFKLFFATTPVLASKVGAVMNLIETSERGMDDGGALTPAPFLAQGRWFLGENTETCDAVCSKIGSTCDQSSLNAVMSDTATTRLAYLDAFSKAWDSMEAEMGSNFPGRADHCFMSDDLPVRNWAPRIILGHTTKSWPYYDCLVGTSSNPLCSATTPGGHRRLCPCMSGLPTSAPTVAPTAPPTAAPPLATAIGDPHLQNIHGERFDLMTTGTVLLISVPRGKRVEDALLAVQADARRLGGHCSDMYFQTVNITGVWADKLQAGGFTFDAQGVQSHKVPQWTKLGPVEVKVVRGRTEKGIKHLNFFVKHLGDAGFAVGGLLGEDDHADAARIPEGCQIRMSLRKASQTSVRAELASVAVAF